MSDNNNKDNSKLPKSSPEQIKRKKERSLSLASFLYKFFLDLPNLEGEFHDIQSDEVSFALLYLGTSISVAEGRPKVEILDLIEEFVDNLKDVGKIAEAQDQQVPKDTTLN